MRSAASRRSGPTSPMRCCRTWRTPAGSSTPSCWCSPSAAACASTRCPSTGSTTPTAASTSSSTAVADLKGVARLLKGFASGEIPVGAIAAQFGAGINAAAPRSLLRQGVLFAAIGIVSTVAYLLLFLALRGLTGAQGANLVALLVTAVANTAANRRFTFGVRGRTGVARHQFEGLLVFGIGLALDQRVACAADRGGRTVPRRRARRSGGRQPAGHRRPLRTAARLGVPPAPHRLTHQLKDTGS